MSPSPADPATGKGPSRKGTRGADPSSASPAAVAASRAGSGPDAPEGRPADDPTAPATEDVAPSADAEEASKDDDLAADDRDDEASDGIGLTADPKSSREPIRSAHWELHPVNPPSVFVARRLPGGAMTAPSEPGAPTRVVSTASTSSPAPASTSAPPSSSAAAAPREGDPPVAGDVAPSAGRADAQEVVQRVQRNIGEVVIGYEGVVRALLVALVAQGHILLEGVPGLAKTYLVRSFSRSLALSFRRIQFTPDMLPSDILGTVVLDPRTTMFEFRPGPIFANVILADEINRAPPKVQSALLEAMQERQVTIEGVSYPLPSPFVVIATENPIELEGTYPLPEAELDRFLFRILMGYPSAENELKLLKQRTLSSDPAIAEGVLGGPALEDLRAQSQEIFVHDDLLRYLAAILRETRNDPRVLSGASPRAGVQFLMAVKAAALFSGRHYATPDDVKDAMFDVLNHRIVLRPEVLALQSGGAAQGDGSRVLQNVVFSILNKVAVPW